MTWHDALLWVLVTFALRAFGANLAWFGRTGPGVHSGSALARAVARLATPDTVSALRVAYLLGVPVAAIAARVVTPSAMGLAAP